MSSKLFIYTFTFLTICQISSSRVKLEIVYSVRIVNVKRHYFKNLKLLKCPTLVELYYSFWYFKNEKFLTYNVQLFPSLSLLSLSAKYKY